MKNNTEKDEAIARLREWIKPGDTLFTVLRHVSRSGMNRVIEVVKIDCTDGEAKTLHLGYNVAMAVGYTYDRGRDGIKVGGCGSDMGFEVVYNLGRVLFPKGGALELSPRESQERRDGQTIEKDGGYLLRQRWL